MKDTLKKSSKDVTGKIILLTNTIDLLPNGGRELLCKMNHDMLKDIYRDRFLLFELSKKPIRNLKSVIDAFKGNIDGLTVESIDIALTTIQSENIGQVFVDGSNLGGIVKIIKKKLPHVEVTTFFHNVEARFFIGAFRQTKTPKALAVFIVNYLAERKAVRYSDKIICLSDRDSSLLKRYYGRSENYVSAMAMQDKLPEAIDLSVSKIKEKFALFVGGTFYANHVGITWFVKHVVPLISVKIYIVGKGFEDLRDKLEVDGKVVVVGEVDSLVQWYMDSYFVIAPIFDGSGMKTKVAEALMFGKKIIGTPEAFSGYEEILDQAGSVCFSAEEFVAAIDSANEVVNSSFDPELRAVYEKKYSYAAAKLRLENIMGL